MQAQTGVSVHMFCPVLTGASLFRYSCRATIIPKGPGASNRQNSSQPIQLVLCYSSLVPDRRGLMDRKTTFFLALVYLTIILAIGLIFFVKRNLLFFVPDAFGPVPVGVPWFGALGAVLISLTGVFEHEHDWDASYWPWHVARPLI